jgi:hypothetical protein
LLDELASRQFSFRPGRPVQLADGQTWILPAPPLQSETNASSFGPEYEGMIRAIAEAEDDSEQRLAELAFAIHLLAHNYRLSPADYEVLLGSSTALPNTKELERAFHDIAQDHVQSFHESDWDFCASDHQNPRIRDTYGWFSRLLAWLRNHSLAHWFSLESRSK